MVSAEVAATVADYLSMLEHELRDEAYNKSDHNQRLQHLLNGRTKAAAELKHQNISAIMIELGLLYIDGYTPLRNYQAILFDEVVAQLTHNRSIERADRVDRGCTGRSRCHAFRVFGV